MVMYVLWFLNEGARRVLLINFMYQFCREASTQGENNLF